MKEEDRKALIEHRIAKADDAVRDVEFLIESKRPLLAVNRIYYGIFYIISALSLKKDFHTSKHQQLIGWFNKEFVASGRVDSRYGKIIHNAFLNYIAKQKKHSNIKDVCYKNLDFLLEDSCYEKGSEAQYFNVSAIDYQVIRGKKKKKRRKKKKKVTEEKAI